MCMTSTSFCLGRRTESPGGYGFTLSKQLRPPVLSRDSEALIIDHTPLFFQLKIQDTPQLGTVPYQWADGPSNSSTGKEEKRKNPSSRLMSVRSRTEKIKQEGGSIYIRLVP